MSAHVVVCDGCCCGRVEKGHNEVPINTLKAAWEEHGLADYVKLTISDCLGPCSMHNVSLLKTENGLTWLGKLSENVHYEALVRWARDFAKFGTDAELPEAIASHRFVRLEDVVVRPQEL
jgi:predicted metal-binding protein|tara:strand:+ start:270 stop:629 length:360 start_codon:yes stop_codon:yes gene_type:complete